MQTYTRTVVLRRILFEMCLHLFEIVKMIVIFVTLNVNGCGAVFMCSSQTIHRLDDDFHFCIHDDIVNL